MLETNPDRLSQLSVVKKFQRRSSLSPDKPKIGQEKAFIKGLKSISNATGPFFDPLPMIPYTRSIEEAKNNIGLNASTIRSWIKKATDYHGVPHVMLAAILQNENPIREEGVKGSSHNALQFGERVLTTLFAWADDTFWDIMPDRIAGSSAGLANLSRKTLRSAAQYSIDIYNKNPIPDTERYRINHWDSDTRMAGRDTKTDFYYAAAHLRQLIDNVTGVMYFNGGLSWQQAEAVISRYNGTGPSAKAYGKRAVDLIHKAEEGKAILNFYSTIQDSQ